MRLQELVRKAIQYGAHRAKEINLSGYDTYEETIQQFFEENGVKNCSIPDVVESPQEAFDRGYTAGLSVGKKLVE